MSWISDLNDALDDRCGSGVQFDDLDDLTQDRLLHCQSLGMTPDEAIDDVMGDDCEDGYDGL